MERASLENFGIFTSLNCYFFQYFVGTNGMLVGLHVLTNFQIYRQTLTLSKCMCMRASGASELRKFWHFYILKLLFLSIFCRYSRYFVGTNDMLVGLHVPTNFLIYRQTLTLSKCMCMRANGASELRKFWHFLILNLLFLSIFCRYIRYFVGTNDMLVGSHVPTNFQMYRQKSEKALLGGQLPPLPPPLATLMLWLPAGGDERLERKYIFENDGLRNGKKIIKSVLSTKNGDAFEQNILSFVKIICTGMEI